MTASDTHNRWLAQSTFNQPVIVEAGAGTGKTTTLIARIVFWSLTQGWNKHFVAHKSAEEIALLVARGIVAITFTEAATQQMAAKLTEAFKSLSVQNSSESVIGLDLPQMMSTYALTSDVIQLRAKALLSVCDEFVIHTIHAYCKKILQQYPKQVQLHPNFMVDADGEHIERIVSQALWEDISLSYQTENQRTAAYQHLLNQGRQLQDIAEALIQLSHEGVSLEGIQYNASTLHHLSPIYVQIITHCQHIVDSYDGYPGKVSDAHLKIRDFLVQVTIVLNAYMSAPNLKRHEEDLIALWKLPDSPEYYRSWTNIKGQSNKCTAAAKALHLQESFQQLLPLLTLLKNFKPQQLQYTQSIFSHLYPIIQERMRRKGVQTFGGLLQNTALLLKEHPNIAVEISQHIDMLIVDEFQDTSQLQCDIIEGLAIHTPHPPSLFIVGDPKQTIYGWRQAEITSYFGFVDNLIEKHNALFLKLFLNYRSTPDILDEVHNIMEPILYQVPKLQPQYIQLQPHRHINIQYPNRNSIEYWLTWLEADPENMQAGSADEKRERQAEMIAEDIKNLVLEDSQSHYGDFAILCRTMSNVHILIQELRKRNIPYRVAGDRNFFQRREIMDACSLLLCLFDPGDHVSLLATLRNYWIQTPDAALWPLWESRLPQLMMEAQYLDADTLQSKLTLLEESLHKTHQQNSVIFENESPLWIDRVILGIRVLLELRQDMQLLPIDAFLQKVRQRLLIDILESQNELSIYRLANLDQLFVNLQQRILQNKGQIAPVLTYLKEAVTSEIQATEAIASDASQQVLSIMTIHKAKGLDFKHVYVVDMDWSPPNSFNRLDSKIIPLSQKEQPKRFGQILLDVSSFEMHSYKEEKDTKALYERIRLLYVALTRAKNRLVLCGNFPKTDDKSWAITLNKSTSFIHLLTGKNQKPGRLFQIQEQYCQYIQNLTTNPIQKIENIQFLFGLNRPASDASEKITESVPTIPVMNLPEIQITQGAHDWYQELDGPNSILEKLHAQSQQIPLSTTHKSLLRIQWICHILWKEHRGDPLLTSQWRQLAQNVSRENRGPFPEVYLETLALLQTLVLPDTITLPSCYIEGRKLLLRGANFKMIPYYFDGLIEEDDTFYLIELVWDFKTLADTWNLNNAHTQDWLIHMGAKRLQPLIPNNQKIQPALWDISSEKFILLSDE